MSSRASAERIFNAEVSQQGEAPVQILRDCELSHQDLRRENRRLRTLLKLRSHIISTSAHEARGALVAINGYGRLLLEGEPGPVTPAQREYLETILENGHKMTSVLGALAKLAWEEDLILEESDLLEIWRRAVRALYPRISRRSIRFRALLPERSVPIAADRRKLGFAVHKLLGGLIHTAAEGGEILATISAPEDQVAVSISTNHIQGRAGDCRPSFLAHRLSIAEETVRSHGGWFSSQSISGEGLIVTFTLPLL